MLSNVVAVIHKGFMFALMQNSKRIFVTGGSGFAGTYICYLLLEQGYQVSALKRHTSNLSTPQLVFKTLNEQRNQNLAIEQIDWKVGDILDPNSLIEASSNCDVMVHTAASVSFQPKERDLILNININGTSNVVTACLENDIKRIIHISSVGGLPNPDKKESLDEGFLNSTFFQFETTYGESKYRSEMEVWKGLGEGLDVTILNPGIILGAWKCSGSSIEMFKTVNNGLPFYSGGLTGFVDVEDVANAVLKALELETSIGNRFILVSENWTYKKLIFVIAEALNKKKPSIKANLKLSEFVALIAEAWASLTGKKAFITRELAQSANRKTSFINDKAKKELNIEFTPVSDSVKKTAAFLQTNPSLF